MMARLLPWVATLVTKSKALNFLLSNLEVICFPQDLNFEPASFPKKLAQVYLP